MLTVRHSYLAMATLWELWDTATCCSPESQLHFSATHALLLHVLQRKSPKREIQFIADVIKLSGQSHSLLGVSNQLHAYPRSSGYFYLSVTANA